MIETNDKLLLDKWYDMIENNEIHGKEKVYSAQDFSTRDGMWNVWVAYVYYVDKIGKYVTEQLLENPSWTETQRVDFFDSENEAKRVALEWLWYKI